MDVNGLIGYIGGYIGLFVGYSIMQIPDTILTIMKKCKKLYSQAMNRCFETTTDKNDIIKPERISFQNDI